MRCVKGVYDKPKRNRSSATKKPTPKREWSPRALCKVRSRHHSIFSLWANGDNSRREDIEIRIRSLGQTHSHRRANEQSRERWKSANDSLFGRCAPDTYAGSIRAASVRAGCRSPSVKVPSNLAGRGSARAARSNRGCKRPILCARRGCRAPRYEGQPSRIYWFNTDSRYSCRPETLGVTP